MKEMVVDFRRAQSDHSPLNINGSSVEIVKSTKFLGVHLAEDLTWSLNTSSITKKAQQCLYFLRRLRKAHLPPLILTTFYRGTIESILSSCITAWVSGFFPPPKNKPVGGQIASVYERIMARFGSTRSMTRIKWLLIVNTLMWCTYFVSRLEELNPQMIYTTVRQYLLPPHHFVPNILAQMGALNT
ncbi:hypothetical protein QTP70_009052 [Hemibagrus guttatus]|uniref:Alkylated DNA repair protein AlkB homologue 8 N-terminal domain-containing protein n=1 Tax=Hemibagrus guttatus TaxID=175788 RepID=A0AAE0V436_9TELE|nr:hypothetical protein QTP70_009052 [Hemibagrus guttatus]KAK3565346.1 hypothetical protein QTP86_007135 [Hemibagrus guttatus]